MTLRSLRLKVLLGMLLLSGCGAGAHPRTFDVRDFGAKGDRTTLDTTALNRAIEAGAGGGGTVLVPRGEYLTGTVHLKSNVTLQLDAGAELIGVPDLNRYDHFTPDEQLGAPEARWHRALVLGEGLHNVAIVGQGTICGNDVLDPQGEEHIRGPHAVLLANCRNVQIRDITIRDAGNYAVLLEFTTAAEVRGVKIAGGWDGVHLRGWIDHPCRDIRIADCDLSTGDDSVAGLYWDKVRIERCAMNSASSGVRIFGPARHVTIADCQMFGPGQHPSPTCRVLHHSNMGAGLCIQPNAWGETPGEVDDVHVSDIQMREVATPLHLVTKGKSAIGTVSIDRLKATGVYRSAASVESWSERPIERVDLRDWDVQFVGGFGPVLNDPFEAAWSLMMMQPGKVTPPGDSPRPLPAWGLYAHRVNWLNLQDVRLKVQQRDARPAVILESVRSLKTDGLTCPGATTRPVVIRGNGS
jgi:hypothetical protein